MSIEGFVASLKRRRADISAEIEKLTIENDGVLPKKTTLKLRQEKDRIDAAIYKAARKGLTECST